MTFYDIVTLIVPSAILCCSNGWLPFNSEPSWIEYVALFGFVLMIGLILKGISVAWNAIWFRNSTKMIFEAENGTNIFKDLACAFICGSFAYVFSIVFYFIDKKDNELLERYYDKYEIAYNNKYSGKRIELLEAQVAFLQSMIWALIFCLVGGILFEHHCPIVRSFSCPIEWWGTLILIYACIVTMIILQKKIYNVVWASTTIVNDAPEDLQEDKKKGTIGQEHNLKSTFWVLCTIVLVMLCIFIIGIGIHSTLSTSSTDYANFSTYIGAIGTMLFTALYAYAFIQLQGTVNNNTQVQKDSNDITKKKEADRKVQRNLAFLVATTITSINACVELLKPYKSNKISDASYSKLSSQFAQVDQNISLVEKYYTQNSIFKVSESDDSFGEIIEQIRSNINDCANDVMEWNQQGNGKSISSNIREQLTSSYNLAKQLETMLISSML